MPPGIWLRRFRQVKIYGFLLSLLCAALMIYLGVHGRDILIQYPETRIVIPTAHVLVGLATVPITFAVVLVATFLAGATVNLRRIRGLPRVLATVIESGVALVRTQPQGTVWVYAIKGRYEFEGQTYEEFAAVSPVASLANREQAEAALAAQIRDGQCCLSVDPAQPTNVFLTTADHAKLGVIWVLPAAFLIADIVCFTIAARECLAILRALLDPAAHLGFVAGYIPPAPTCPTDYCRTDH